MIDIFKVDELFIKKLGSGYINYTSIYTPFDQNNYFDLSKKKLIEGVEYIIQREWFVRPVVTFDIDKIVGKQINIDEFLGSHFDKSSNSLRLTGEKQWLSQYFTYPYDENYKKCILKSDWDFHNPFGFSSCFQTGKLMENNFRHTNVELNEIFLNLKNELLDKELPLIYKWNDKWINIYDFEFSGYDDAIWTLFYPESELTIIIFPIMDI